MIRRLLGIKQGTGLTQPIKALQIGSRFGRIAHPGDPVLDYCVLNSYVEPSTRDPDALRLVKIERGTATERIDSAVAVLTAWQRLIAWKAEKSPGQSDASAGRVRAAEATGRAMAAAGNG